MSDTLNPKPLAATKNDNVENEQGTPKSQLIKEWICAMEDNMKKRDIDAAVTLYCIRCKDFDPNEVVNCKANGCALWWCRTKALMLEEEPKQSNVTVELELAVEGMTWDQMRNMERALRDVKVYANDTRICLSKKK